MWSYLSWNEKMAISQPRGWKWIKEDHFLFYNFKSLRKQSGLVLFIFGPWAEIWPFSHFFLSSILVPFFWDTLYPYSRLYQPKHPNVLRWNWSKIQFTCSAGLAWWKWPLKDSLLEQKWPKMTFLWAKTTILGWFFNKNATKWYLLKK